MKHSNVFEFYDLKESLGRGKFGSVKRGIHKKTRKEVAIKIVKKKDQTIKDIEMLRREIEVLKIC